MKLTRIATAVLGATILGASGIVLSADKPDLGMREYERNCTGCHGIKGKGDGPYMAFLQKSPSDLTVLAKKNNGVFPFARVYEVIDGQQEVPAHGKRDMPIWGSDYNAKAAPDYDDYYVNREVFVRARILALTEYLYRLQAK